MILVTLTYKFIGHIMKFLITTLVAGGIVTCAATLANVQADDDCAQIKQIIDSGMDRQNPFAAIAGLNLPNAVCETDVGDPYSNRNYYRCEWNAANYSKLDELDEEKFELLMAWGDHEGGREAWDEAEELIDEANYWVRTWNAGIQQVPNPNRAQLAMMMEWKTKAEQLQRQAHRAEETALELDREYEELETKFDAKERELEDFKKELETMEKRQADSLYTGLYECFSSGAIGNSAFQVDVQEKEWKLESGCTFRIRTRGPVLYFSCPNPSYQVQ